jgi:hypothetical protein
MPVSEPAPVAPPLPVTAPAIPGAPAASPLSAEHLEQLRAAQARGAKVRRAIAVARFGGWSVGIFGGLTLLFGILTVPGWVMGLGLIVAAVGEFSGAAGLRRFDPIACRRLAYNQLFLAGLLIVYAALGVYSSLWGPDPLAETSSAASPDVAALIAPYSSVMRNLMAGVYAAVAIAAVAAQGGTAWFYFTREKYVRAYLAETPAWVVDFLRAQR